MDQSNCNTIEGSRKPGHHLSMCQEFLGQKFNPYKCKLSQHFVKTFYFSSIKQSSSPNDLWLCWLHNHSKSFHVEFPNEVSYAFS